MKITVSKNEFYNKLKMVGKLVGSSKTLPAVENFLFDISEQFVITGSDVSGVISGVVETISIERDSTKPVKFLVDKTLIVALKEMAEQPIELIIDEKKLNITVKYHNGEFAIQGGSIDAFPIMKICDDHVTILLERRTLIEGIKSVLPFVANDELRPAMNGIYMQYSAGSLAFVATDATMLSVREYTDIEFPDFGSIIPAKAAKMMLDVLNESKDEVMDISIGSKNITISTDIYTLVYRLIEGRYPNFRAVIPKNHDSKLTINTEEFISTVRRVSVFANRNSSLLKLKINGNVINVDAEDTDFSVSASETIFAEYEGNPIHIGFHATRLADVLGVVTSSDCQMKFVDATRAAIIQPVGLEGVTLLIMPMLINN